MQDLLSQLSPPILIGLIVVGVLALVIVVLLARRLRQRQAPPPEEGFPIGGSVGGPIDYTSIPLDEEPRGWRDRFANLSIAGKILVVLVPLLAILGVIVLILTLMPPGGGQASPPPPTPVPVTMAFISEPALVSIDPVQTVGVTLRTSGLADGTPLTVEMLEDGQPFAWLDPALAQGSVRRDRAEIRVPRAEGAPTPSSGRAYSVVVRTEDGGVSVESELVIPEIGGYPEAFFGQASAAAPAPTATAAPPTPTAAAAPEATPEPTAPPAPDLPTGPAAGVSNGGNVRALPLITPDNVIGGVNAEESVQLIARTPNGEWYRVRTIRDEVGWVSVTLLSIPPEVLGLVPVAPVVTVFVNGPLYDLPDPTSTELDRVNVSEVVELKQKTADGTWYFVTNARGIDGWVPANLLGIPADVAASVPVTP